MAIVFAPDTSSRYDEALGRPMADLVGAIAPWLARGGMLCRRMRRSITALMIQGPS